VALTGAPSPLATTRPKSELPVTLSADAWFPSHYAGNSALLSFAVSCYEHPDRHDTRDSILTSLYEQFSQLS